MLVGNLSLLWYASRVGCFLSQIWWALFSKVLFVSNPCILKQYSNLLGFDEAEFDRCRVVFVFYPKKCVLVATYSDDDHLADAHSTLEDAFGGGSSKTPTFSMDSTIVCINGIFSSPGISASSISANIGIFSESVVEILWYWVSGSGSVEACYGCVRLVVLGLLLLLLRVPLAVHGLSSPADSPDHGVQVAAAISLPLHPFARAVLSTFILFHLLLHLLLEWACFGYPSLCSSGGSWMLGSLRSNIVVCCMGWPLMASLSLMLAWSVLATLRFLSWALVEIAPIYFSLDSYYESQQFRMLFLLTSKWRVLDGVCPSSDLVNVVVQVWSIGDDLFKEGYVFLDADCILVEGCSMELVLWSLGLYVPHAWYARVAWFVPALLYWFVVVCCSL
ncbi:hypothetical protein POTOM_047422 [Populus tomentosa]|uniref:Uncharacterized protein n=1 Tax=Populus tomentosa TaxID=118781 RepID=A0A8X7YKV1_POPTO|nr:hypothetical protein POTOM_047422 [Populus tomentosa]